MRAKLLFLACLLPVSVLSVVVLSTLFIDPELPPEISLHLSYFLVSAFGVWLFRYKFSYFRWKIEFKDISVALLLGLLLFGSFYVETVIFQDYQKGQFGMIEIISAVVLAPVLEEFFTKALLLENIEKLKMNPLFGILVVAGYFWILHFPTLLLTQLLVGLVTTFLYYFRRNLSQVILVHCSYNGLIILMNYF